MKFMGNVAMALLIMDHFKCTMGEAMTFLEKLQSIVGTVKGI